MTVATFKQSDYNTQTGTEYPLAIDASMSVMARLAAAYAPHAEATPTALKVVVDPGAMFVNGALVANAAQTVTLATAHATLPRIDRVVIDVLTGVASKIDGTAAASPVAPAITAGKFPVSQVQVDAAMTVVTNSKITDERTVLSDVTSSGKNKFTNSNTFQGRVNFADTVGGTANAITATFDPPFTALVDKMRVVVRATAANTGAVTFIPDGVGSPTSVAKASGAALVAGDILGSGHNIDLIFNATTGVWVILNPAKLNVAQADLKTTTAASSVSVNPTASATITLTGGTYSWYTLSGDAVNPNAVGWGAGNTAAGVLGFFNDSGSGHAIYCDERYVQASPPYNHGPLFVFLALRADGSIAHISVACDPPWAYHGPTDIRPQYYRDGKAYRRIKTINGVPAGAARKNPAILRALMQETAIVAEEEVEVTLAYKDSDQAVMPHPFIGNDLTGLTVILLEPGTALMQKIFDFDFSQDGVAIEARDLILGSNLIINNIPIDLPNSPPGVMILRARWKK